LIGRYITKFIYIYLYIFILISTIGLTIGSNKNAANLAFESDDLKQMKIDEGSHLQVQLMRPEFAQCKGDSLCRMLSNEMPKSSKGFTLKGGMDNGKLFLNTPISEPLVVNKALQLSEASLRMNVDRHVDISVPTSMQLPGINVPFTGKCVLYYGWLAQ